MLCSLGVDVAANEIDLDPARQLRDGLEIFVATDVDNPLLGARGASRGFGPQKFANPERVLEVELADMDAQLADLAHRVGRRPDGKDPAVALGSGAAGGLGFGLIALGATRVPGISTVLDALHLADRLVESDLVVTGEGCFDWQSLRGKTISGVAELALANARPAVVLAGSVEVGRREFGAIGVAAAFSVAENCGSVELAMSQPAQTLRDLAARVAGTWGGS
jgi:glycerate kinase